MSMSPSVSSIGNILLTPRSAGPYCWVSLASPSRPRTRADASTIMCMQALTPRGASRHRRLRHARGQGPTSSSRGAWPCWLHRPCTRVSETPSTRCTTCSANRPARVPHPAQRSALGHVPPAIHAQRRCSPAPPAGTPRTGLVISVTKP
jgi:hypothetical protein